MSQSGSGLLSLVLITKTKLQTGLSLVEKDHVTRILGSDWLMRVTPVLTDAEGSAVIMTFTTQTCLGLFHNEDIPSNLLG